jgi:ribosomal protein S15P/S13E
VLLLHFSLAVSRMSDQIKVLAQRLALLDEHVRKQERDAAAERDRSDAEAFIRD